MKIKLILAFILFLAGVADIVNWIVFAERNSALAESDYLQFKEKFITSFPELIQPLYRGYPAPASLLLIVIFIIAGVIFLKGKKLFYRIMAILSFILGFWYVFSLM